MELKAQRHGDVLCLTLLAEHLDAGNVELLTREDGKPVQVTEVCIPGTAPSPWPDTKRVGTVTRYLRRLTTRGSVLK